MCSIVSFNEADQPSLPAVVYLSIRGTFIDASGEAVLVEVGQHPCRSLVDAVHRVTVIQELRDTEGEQVGHSGRQQDLTCVSQNTNR